MLVKLAVGKAITRSDDGAFFIVCTCSEINDLWIRACHYRLYGSGSGIFAACIIHLFITHVVRLCTHTHTTATHNFELIFVFAQFVRIDFYFFLFIYYFFIRILLMGV